MFIEEHLSFELDDDSMNKWVTENNLVEDKTLHNSLPNSKEENKSRKNVSEFKI